MILFDVFLASAIFVQATWYGGPLFEGNIMRNGDVFRGSDPTVIAVGVDDQGAPLMPLGTKLKVCSERACIVGEVKDTGYLGRNIDLSPAAFIKLADLRQGRIWVSVEVFE